LALAALVYLVASPRSLQDVGFQLSFATVFGLALALRPGPSPGGLWRRGGRSVGDVARASGTATPASGPRVAHQAGLLSFASIPANVLIAFVLPPLMVTSLGALAASTLLPAVAAGAMRLVVEPLAGWVLWVVSTLGAHPWAAVVVPPFHPYWIAVYYGVWLVLWRRTPRPATGVPC